MGRATTCRGLVTVPSSSLSDGPSRVLVEKGEETVFGRRVTYNVYADPQGRKSREVVVGLHRSDNDEKLATTFSSHLFVEPGMFTGLYERLTGNEFDPATNEEHVQQVLDDAREYVAKERQTRDEFYDGSTSTGVVECSFGCGRSISPDQIKPTGWLVDGSVVNRDDVFHACPYHVDVLRELEEFDDGVPESKPLDEIFGGGEDDE